MKIRLKQIETVVEWVNQANNIFDVFNSTYQLKKSSLPLYSSILSDSKISFYASNANHKLSAECYYYLEYALENIYKPFHPTFKKTVDEVIEECYETNHLEPDELVGYLWATAANTLFTKFADKWDRIWYSLTKDYNPLSNYDMTETEKYNTDKKKETNINQKTKTNTDTKTKQSVDQDTNTEEYVRGFNSSRDVKKGETKVSQTGSPDNNFVQTNGLAENNYTDVTAEAEDNYEREIGNADDNFRHLEKSGNIGVRSNQELLEQELEVRKNNFIEIVFSDIQSVIFNRVY